jgi:predicted component of type VI protein secretion system
MLQAKLKVVGGRHHGRVIPLATKKFLIGREQDCHLRPNSELVSRHHCVFAVDDFSVHVRDLGSTNGTFVNDQRVRGEVLLNSGDRIRVGKLDFELVIGEPVAAAGSNKNGDSSQLLPGLSTVASNAETAPLVATDTSFEIPVPAVPEDTGSSIIAESATPVPAAPPPPPAAAAVANPGLGDSTVVWSPPASPGYSPEMYPSMGMPYPQAPYQPAYPYGAPAMGYQMQYPYPQMPMNYPGMYPQMGPPMGMYPPAAPSYAPPGSQPAGLPEPEPEPENEDTGSAILNVRLPDPKTTGAKAPPALPVPQAAPAPQAAAPPPGEENPLGAAAKPEEQKQAPPVKPSEGAADILKKYTQRRPV